jgi:excisionase family DNA binding protein
VSHNPDPEPNPEDVWFTVSEVARFLNTTERHVRRLVFERRIPVTRIGGRRGRLRFNKARILDWLDHDSEGPEDDGRGRAA